MTESKTPAGHPMDPIAEQFKRDNPAPDDMPVSSGGAAHDRIALLLSPENVGAPAFFVDRDLSVRWVADGGQDPLSQALVEQLAAVSTRNAFNLLIREPVKSAVSDWQSFFSFVYGLLKRSTSSPTFESRTRFLGDTVTPDIWRKDDDPADTPDVAAFAVASRPMALTGLPEGEAARIFGLDFPAGTLFVIRPDHWHEKTATTTPVELPAAPVPSDHPTGPQSICVLSALLSEARQLADTMLPDRFVAMMHEINRETDDLCRSLGGRQMASKGAKLQYMFTESAGRDPIFSAISCALRLNAWIQKRQDKNSARQGWSLPLALKIGISHGKGRFAESGSEIGDSMFIPGGAVDQSFQLAAFAKAKEIWITRDALTQLPGPLVEQLVWGVDREGRFQQHFFARLGELKQTFGCGSPHPEIDVLSVARIFKITSTAPDRPAPH